MEAAARPATAYAAKSTRHPPAHCCPGPADGSGSIKWGIDSRGRIKIESKDDMRKRGMPSPDRADAMAIAFAGRANAAPMNVESHAGESITGDPMTKAW